MRIWCMLIPNLLKEMDLILLSEQRGCYAMYRRVSPALVNGKFTRMRIKGEGDGPRNRTPQPHQENRRMQCTPPRARNPYQRFRSYSKLRPMSATKGFLQCEWKRGLTMAQVVCVASVVRKEGPCAIWSEILWVFADKICSSKIHACRQLIAYRLRKTILTDNDVPERLNSLFKLVQRNRKTYNPTSQRINTFRWSICVPYTFFSCSINANGSEPTSQWNRTFGLPQN